MKGGPYQYENFLNILTIKKRFCLIVSCWEKQLEEKLTPKDVQSNIFKRFSSPNIIRAKLEPYEYVEERQIHALFSQWSKKYCEETLHEPAAAGSNGEHVTQENHETDYCNDNKEEQSGKLV